MRMFGHPWGHGWGLGLVAFWTLLVAFSLQNTLAMLDEQVRGTALSRARMLFTMVETTRLWNSTHGGVYAPVSADTPPNEWLVDPERDVTINGRAYTKINPSYMTRQISELVGRRQDVTFHLTSRNPIRPSNGPDPWEAAVLDQFEQGVPEVLAETEIDGQGAFRYMARLLVVEPCLHCHANQGYKLGDVRGGISVTIPGPQVLSEFGPQRQQTWLLHGIGFLLLSGASLLFMARLKVSWRELAAAKAEQERIVAERTAELSAAVAELGRSNAELQQFAYAASHDLQEPLRMMGAYAQLIQKRYGPALDADGREFLGYMGDGAHRMKAMIDDLLAYSRVSRGEAAFTAVRMDDVVDGALLNLSAALAESDAAIARPAPLPEIWGEAPLLTRLMQNLVGNAVKYRRPGLAPHITIAAEPSAGGWIFSVADNGIGIPVNQRERVFQIFQRLHSKSEYPGTGIGLAIAKRIVERHGGQIWVEGDASGSVFRFTLKAAGPDVAAPQQGAAG